MKILNCNKTMIKMMKRMITREQVVLNSRNPQNQRRVNRMRKSKTQGNQMRRSKSEIPV
jgi:hypothetical protein